MDQGASTQASPPSGHPSAGNVSPVIYRRTYRCSENFPVEKDQEWSVREGNKVAEKWRVLRGGRASFEVEIQEFIPEAM